MKKAMDLFPEVQSGTAARSLWSPSAGILAFCTFTLVPFLGGNHLAFFYVNIDRFWLETVFILLLILSILATHVRGNRDHRAYQGFCIYFLPFLAMSVAGVFYSWNPFNGILACEVLLWAAGTAYLYLLSPRKEVCLAGLVTGGTLSAVSAILQHFFLFPNLTSVFTQGMYAHLLREQSAIPFSSYLHHNMLGGYLASIFPLAIYFSVRGKTRAGAFTAVAASALILTGVVLSSSRISIGLVCLGLVACIVLTLRSSSMKGLVRICAAAVLSLAVIFGVLHEGEKKAEVRVQGVIAQKVRAAGKDLSTLNTRTDIWKNAVHTFSRRPAFGFGTGAFEYGYRKYFDGGSYTTAAHSVLVKTGVETGVAGLVCFLFYILGVFLAVRRREMNPGDRFLLLCAVSGLLFGLVDFSFDVASHVITFFVITSHFFFLGKADTESSSVRARSPVAGYALFGTVVLVLLVSFLFHTRTDMMKRDIEHGDFLNKNGFPVRALNAYREAMAGMPLNPEPRVKAASVLMQLVGAEKKGVMADSMKDELRGYLTSLGESSDRNGERYLVMGKGYALLGEGEKARSFLTLALQYYPSSPYYVYETAAYYHSADEPSRALEVIRSFDPYLSRFRTPHNPRGFFVYRIRDLEASIELSRGQVERARALAEDNLKDAKSGAYVITSSRSREYVRREGFVRYLEDRVRLIENSPGAGPAYGAY